MKKLIQSFLLTCGTLGLVGGFIYCSIKYPDITMPLTGIAVTGCLFVMVWIIFYNKLTKRN